MIAVLLAVVVMASLLLGRYPAPGFVNPARLADDDLARQLVITLRLPRILMAVALGMCLAAAGTVFQHLFANPMVEPGFLGVSQGASFGASLAIILVGPVGWLIQASAAAFALTGLGLTYLISSRGRFGDPMLRLILAGIAVSALFFSLAGMIRYLADPLTQLPTITLWLLGGLTAVTWPQVATITPVVFLGVIVAYRARWRLNLLSLDDATAYSLGAAPAQERALLMLAAVAITAAVVSVCGDVRWLGLIVPHIARRMFGADARYALPAALLLGALIGVVCDDLARTLLPGEIPIGVLTSLGGSLFFVAILIGRRGKNRRPETELETEPEPRS